ncbi:MAG TPA: transcriptional regulator, partial [Candidatus Bacteroides pullicola]|nr:transcriptional regulator [Candidatus Bacteroides pullicola]
MFDRDDTKLWFAMSAPYQNELRVQRLLDKASIECFIPMCYKAILRNGKKYRVWQPAVSNLVFVRATR